MAFWIGLGVPFLGTILGAGMVFFLKKKVPDKVEKCMMGFAAGVMVAASFFSLLLPALEESSNSVLPGWATVTIGFLGGIFFLLILDEVIPHVHDEEEEGIHTSWRQTTKLFLAMALHNIPEGMSLGIVLATLPAGGAQAALALAIGIAIQNVPEGAVLSFPLRAQGLSRMKAFLYGSASGIVEPIGALLTLWLSVHILSWMPWLLAFAAGAMIYVCVEELIPRSQHGHHTNLSTIAFAFGFVCMMILDGVLG